MERELQDAIAIGITLPERVRILAVDSIPNPLLGLFAWLERWTSLCVSNAKGMTLRYGIYAVPPFDTDRQILAHELAHVRQYEIAGSRFTFLRKYILQCMEHGYHDADFERDARDRAAECEGRTRVDTPESRL